MLTGEYTLRYVAGTDLKWRFHDVCVARFASYDDAEGYRQTHCPQPELLEVVQR